MIANPYKPPPQIMEFQILRGSWAHRVRAAGTNVGEVQVRLIPGHQEITGNTRADSLAKLACDLDAGRSVKSIARASKLLEERYNVALALSWE